MGCHKILLWNNAFLYLIIEYSLCGCVQCTMYTHKCEIVFGSSSSSVGCGLWYNARAYQPNACSSHKIIIIIVIMLTDKCYERRHVRTMCDAYAFLMPLILLLLYIIYTCSSHSRTRTRTHTAGLYCRL